MPIKLKKSNIQFDIDKPEPGYMILGFDDQGTLVYKDSDGNYDTIIPTISTANFAKLKSDYLTIGFRSSGQFEGFYSYAQGESTISSGYTTMTQGKSVTAQGDYSTARGEYTHAIGKYSLSSGKGISTANKLISGGLNSFVHSYATEPSGTYANYSAILGGLNHNIEVGANYSTIIGGNSNTILTNVNNSAIIACYEHTSEHDYTVHVPRLVLVDGTYTQEPPDGTIFYNGSDILAKLGGVDVSLSVQTTGLVTSVGATTPELSNTGSANAPIITHSIASGYKHIPSGGSTNEYLKYSSSGTAVWSAIPSGLSISGNVNNRVLTAGGDSTIYGESELTYNGTTLNVSGEVTISSTLTVNGNTNFVQYFPITPASPPATDYQVANKFYVDHGGKTTGWLYCSVASGFGSGTVYAKQLGGMITITGTLNCDHSNADLVFTIPSAISICQHNIYFIAGDGGDSSHDGVNEFYIVGGSRNVRGHNINSDSDFNEEAFCVTYPAG